HQRDPGIGAHQTRHSGWIRRNQGDRKSTRLNSSHANISYAVFCLKKKRKSSSVRSGAAFAPPALRMWPLPPRNAPKMVGMVFISVIFFLNDTAPPEIYPFSQPHRFPI